MVKRTLQFSLESLVRDYPVVYLTGPRQSGKTTLCRATFPDYVYLSLEDLETWRRALRLNPIFEDDALLVYETRLDPC